MLSRLFFRSITLVAIGGALAIGHSLIPLKYPIILGTPKQPAGATKPAGTGAKPPVSSGQPETIANGGKAGTPEVAPAGPGLDISITEGKTFFEQGAPFVDARHTEEYAAGHVLNAFHLTADLLVVGKGLEVLSMLDPGAPVVVYCGGGMCDASKNLVNYLQAAGFTQCHIMHDGYPAWVAAGHPTATGLPEIGE